MKYKCLVCGDQFPEKVNCIQHHLEKKHEDFELIETEVKLNIKTCPNK